MEREVEMCEEAEDGKPEVEENGCVHTDSKSPYSRQSWDIFQSENSRHYSSDWKLTSAKCNLLYFLESQWVKYQHIS
jgi:hypothetical protein